MKKNVLFLGFGDIQLELARRFLTYRGLSDRIEVTTDKGTPGQVDGYVVNSDELAAVSRITLLLRTHPAPVLCIGAEAAFGTTVFAPGPFKPSTADRLGEMMASGGNATHSAPVTSATAQPSPAPAAAQAMQPRPAPAPASIFSPNKVIAFPRTALGSSNADVLVVDDSEMVRRTMMRKINQYGHTSDLAANGEEAMAMLLNNKYRVIFLDVMMPGIDGLEICKRIKRSAEFKGTAVYMLTSKDGMFDRVRATMAGCDGYLVKPLESRKLRDVLEKYFERPSMIGESSIQGRDPFNAAERAAIDGTPPPTQMEPLAPPMDFKVSFAPTVPAHVGTRSDDSAVSFRSPTPINNRTRQ